MRKVLQIVALLALTCSTASAHLIHSLHIRNGGKGQGFRDVGEYSGLFINRQWCLGDGNLRCPYPCGSIIRIPITNETVKANTNLATYEIDFIREAMISADNSLLEAGMITKVFLVNGVQKVITAKFTKSLNGIFVFNVVSNFTYEENLNELSAL
jgi:hypothetical protein